MVSPADRWRLWFGFVKLKTKNLKTLDVFPTSKNLGTKDCCNKKPTVSPIKGTKNEVSPKIRSALEHPKTRKELDEFDTNFLAVTATSSLTSGEQEKNGERKVELKSKIHSNDGSMYIYPHGPHGYPPGN